MGKFGAFMTALAAKANKKVIVGTASALAVCTAGGVGAGVYLNKPEVVAANAISGFVEDFVEREEIAPIANMLKKGSLEFSLSKINKGDMNYLEDMSVDGKMYFSSKAFMLEDVNVKVRDLKVSADMYVSEDLIYIQEDEILDEAYGIEVENFASNLEDSIFAYGSGSDYAIPDKDLYEAIIEAMEDPISAKEMRKDVKKITKAYGKDIYKIVCEHAEFESEKDEVRIGGSKEKVRVVTVTIDEKAMANIVADVYDYVRDDDKVIEFLEKYESKFQSIIEYSGMEQDSIVELYEEMLDNLGENIDEICDEIEDEASELELELITRKSSSKLLKMTVKSDGDEMISIDVGMDGIKKSNKITLEAAGAELVYEIKTNDKEAYEAVVEVNDNKICTIEVDRDKEKFEIWAGAEEGASITVSGTFVKEGKATTINFKKAQYKHEEYEWNDATYSYEWVDVVDEYTSDLTLTINQSDKMPKAPEDFVTIDEITEEDIEQWMKNVYGD